ncbi:MAG: hypothetical protein ACFFFC_10685, partial [Candidatus Thorarchaeota archaeon]
NIGSLTSLTSLNIDGNQLTSLPKSIINLDGLQGINLRGNRFRTFPEETVEWLQKLQSKGCRIRIDEKDRILAT